MLRYLIPMKNGRYCIKFSKQAVKNKIKLKNLWLDKTAIKILLAMEDDSFCYPPSYEKLIGDLSGYYSRRINRQHRIVYRVLDNENEIHVISMWTHCEN